MHTDKRSVGAALPALVVEKDVCRWLGMSRQSLATLIKAGAFPAPVRIGLKRKAWSQPELNEWFDSRRGVAVIKNSG